jgi:hypothetical protein
MTKTLGLIGAGNIGSALARLAVAAGVLSNSRGPETLADLVAELGEQARAAPRRGRAGRRPLLRRGRHRAPARGRGQKLSTAHGDFGLGTGGLAYSSVAS